MQIKVFRERLDTDGVLAELNGFGQHPKSHSAQKINEGENGRTVPQSGGPDTSKYPFREGADGMTGVNWGLFGPENGDRWGTLPAVAAGPGGYAVMGRVISQMKRVTL